MDLFVVGIISAVFILFLTGFIFLQIKDTRLNAQLRRYRQDKFDLEEHLNQYDAIFNSFPGMVLVWDIDDVTEAGWGNPKVFGSSMALASVLRFAEAGDGTSLPICILDGLADYPGQTPKGKTVILRHKIHKLRQTGESFSMVLLGPSGRVVEVDGRVAGVHTILWFSDSTFRGLEEIGQAACLDEIQESLAEHPSVFMDILDSAPYPVWRMTAAGRLIWANQAYVSKTRAKTLRLALKHQVLLDESLPQLTQQALDKGETQEEERPVIFGRHSSILHFFFLPSKGLVTGFALDKTKEKNAENALQKHVLSQDAILNHLNEAAVIFDSERRLLFFNKAFTEMFFLDEAWLSERPHHCAVLDRLREAHLIPEQADYESWRENELRRYEYVLEDVPDEFWPLPDGRTLRMASLGHPTGGLMLLFEDITDQVTLRAQYNTLIKVQTATLDRLNEGVAVFGSDGRLRLYNRAFLHLWNLEEKLIEGECFFEDLVKLFLPLFYDKTAWKTMKTRITDPSPEIRREATDEIHRSDGSILTCLSRPLPDGATIIAWDDVTQSRRTTEALKERTEALEQVDRIKNQFVGHVSYQLRTPLQTISGYADFLLEKYTGHLEGQQEDALRMIHEAAQDLTKTINNILDITAIETDTLKLEKGKVDLYGTLKTCLSLLTTRADETHVTLKLDCPENIGVMYADQKRLKQALHNLLLNALHFTSAGGEIVLGAQRSDKEIRIWVADNGKGIEHMDQPYVFSSFEASSGGTGLGLVLVRNLIELHGGWVELESAPGEGVCVTCHFPENHKD